MLGLAVPLLPRRPLVRRDDGNKPRDGLAEEVCDRDGSIGTVSLVLTASLEPRLSGKELGGAMDEPKTETLDIAVVATSSARSFLAGRK